MDEKQIAQLAENCWTYAKSVGAVMNPNFRNWFENRARQLYQLNDQEIGQIWAAAIRMHS